MQVTCLAVLFAACLGAPFDPKFCAPPTYEQCAADPDSGTACDKYFREQARTDPDAGCNILYLQKSDSLKDAYPQTERLQPSWYSMADGGYRHSDGGTRMASTVPASKEAFNISGLDNMYLGSVQRYAVQLPKTTNFTVGLTATMDVGALTAKSDFEKDRAAWEANGNTVMSCDEYVHEKYFDYSQFEDALTYIGLADHREIYKAAYSPGYLGTPATAALGYNKIRDPVLRGRDGTPFASSFPFETTIPKNDFFLVPTAGPTIWIQNTPNGIDGVGSDGLGHTMVALAHLHRKHLNLAGVVLEDQTLEPLLDAGREYYQQTFAWHEAMSQRNASQLDEVMYSWDQRQTEFKELLATREATVAAIATAMGGASGTRFTTRYDGKAWLDPYWNPDPTTVDLSAKLNGVDITMGSGYVNPFDANAAQPKPPPPPDPPPSTPKTPAYARPSLSAQVVAACTGSPLICLFYKLEAIDDEIENTLQDVRSTCLVETPFRDGSRPCDWSPKKFSAAVLEQFVAERETQYQLCQSYTYDDFASITNKSFCFPSTTCGDIDIAARNYTKNPTTVEDYFVARAAYLAAIKAYLGDIYNPSPPPTFLVQRDVADYWEGGDPDLFEAHADYEVNFEVSDFDKADHCAIKESMKGGVHAWVRALGSGKFELIDGSIKVTDTKTDAHLTVLGNSLPLIDIDNEQHTMATSYVGGTEEETDTFIDVHTTFVIVVVPVTLGARVTGTVGVDYGVTAANTTTTVNGACEIKNAGVTGQITPYVRVDGEIYAAVDAFVVSAGIKGTITIASASIPVTADISIAPDSMDLNLSNIRLDSDARVSFVFLSGKISAYIQVGICPFCAEYDKDLLAWDGLHDDIPLFHTETTIPLQDLRALAESPPVVQP